MCIRDSPGNMLVDDGGETPRIIILDVGLVTPVTPQEGQQMVDIALKMLQHHGYEAGMLMLDHAKVKECEEVEAFCKGVEWIVDHSFDDTDEYSSFGTYLLQVCGLACTHRVKVDPKYLSVAMALKTLEGTSMALDPSSSIVGDAIPVVMKAQALYTAQQMKAKVFG
eukprot:TRINITY_DN24578_c0_g2_i3.p1 TRINITY_DN24578_c0_g2~~TRINITY_DN24578_c0_g2_i3.p1  ORF type:complete len:167 (+),score=60.53 TRINITY_DN24578_c0_g2_i3:134-634(+)